MVRSFPEELSKLAEITTYTTIATTEGSTRTPGSTLVRGETIQILEGHGLGVFSAVFSAAWPG